MFSVLEGIDNFTQWISSGPIGWVILNPLFLSIAITIVIVVLHEYYCSEPENDDDHEAGNKLTKFTVYTFLVVFVPIMINNNVIDRKRVVGNFEMSEEDFIEWN